MSDSSMVKSKKDATEFLKTELSKLFEEIEITDVLPAYFANATISADSKTEYARPTSNEILEEYNNIYVVGDWIQCDLPCTMESAAKSAFDLNLRK